MQEEEKTQGGDKSKTTEPETPAVAEVAKQPTPLASLVGDEKSAEHQEANLPEKISSAAAKSAPPSAEEFTDSKKKPEAASAEKKIVAFPGKKPKPKQQPKPAKTAADEITVDVGSKSLPKPKPTE